MGNAFLRVSVLLQKNYNNINTMKDSTNEKKTYAPPQLTVVTFKMEQGFTASNELTGTNSVILGEWLFGNNSQGEYVGRTEYGSAFGETWN